MLQVCNRTPFAAMLGVFPDPAGVECVYAAIKATFDLHEGAPRLAVKPARFLAADVFWGDPAKTSLRAAADVTLIKPCTDVVLAARAVAARPVGEMDVCLAVGPVRRTVRVFGPRRWARGEGGWCITEPEPFERMPLRWEYAFGGVGRIEEGRPPEHEARNPVGAGFHASYEEDFQDRPLPNIEDPEQLICQPLDRPPPAGFAPVAPTWMPRRAYAGTYDAQWQKSRAPFLPADFDARYFNTAATGLAAPGYLVGGESVTLSGCSAGGPLRFDLPRASVELEWDFDGRHIEAAAKLDTVLIEPDFARLQMVWRACLAVDKRVLRMRQLTVSCPEFVLENEVA